MSAIKREQSITGRLLTTDRVGKYYDVSPETVRNWCKRGQGGVRFVRVGGGHYLVDSDSLPGWPSDRDPKPEWDEQSECVYFVHDDKARAIKIGYTDQTVRERVRQLAQGIPYRVDLVVLLSMRGPKVLEQHVHIEFSHLRVKGEWFSVAPELVAFIVKHGGNPPREA